MKKMITMLLTLLLLAGGMVEAQQQKQMNTAGNTNASFMPAKQSVKPSVRPERHGLEQLQSLLSPTSVTLFTEDFSTGITNWTIVGDGQGAWSQSNSNLAGGTAPELLLEWTSASQFDGTSCCMSPVINTTGYTTLALNFKHEIGLYTPGTTSYKLCTTIDNGTTWLEVWSVTPTADVLEAKNIMINNAHVGNANFRFAFVFNGNTYDIWEWAIDDVTLFVPDPHDLGVVAITPNFVQSGATVTPEVTVQNFGTNTETTWSVTLTDGGSYTSTVNGTSIAPGATSEVTMGSWTPAIGEYTLTATVTVASDGNTLNDELEITVNVMDVVSAFAWNATGWGTTDAGPINIILPTGTLSQITTDEGSFIAGADYVNNEIYGIRYSESGNSPLVKINPTTGIVTTIGGGAPSLTGFAYDVTTGTAYVMDFDGVLYSINLNNGTVTQIGGSYTSAIALACGGDGTLYAVSVGTDDLATINKTTGAATVVGGLGVDIGYAQDIGYDRDNNILYGTLYSSEGGLYTINTSTGAATLITTLDDELTGFAVPYTVSGPIATTLTPAADAPNVAIDATVSATFNVPIFAVDLTGITITPNPGSVSASINGAVLTIAHADFDYNTTYTVNIPEGSVDDGTDENGTDITWSFTTMLDPIACNTPSDIVVSNVQEFEATVTWTENGAGASWNIAYGAPGFNPASGGTSVVSNTTQFTLTNLTDNTQYELYVQANCGEGETSEWGGPVAFKTKKDCVPITTIPFEEGFEGDVFPPECWEVVNSHSSPTSNWHISAGSIGNGAEVLWSDDSMMDEWLISPKFDFSAVTSSIELSFDIMMSYTWMVENEGADLFVKTSTDGGNTWNSVWREEDLGYFENWTYYNPKVNFNHLMGQSNVKFAFHFYGNDGAQTVIDNVKVDYATGIREVDPNQVKIYPNPSDGIVNIVATEASHIAIYDMVGKLISTHRVDAQEVLTIQQASGLYIIKVETEKGISSYKLVIK